MDVHHGHLTEEFRSSLSSVSTNIFFIPSGCCCRLQPLDVCVTPVLRNYLQVFSVLTCSQHSYVSPLVFHCSRPCVLLQVRWTQLESQGGVEGLGLDQLALTLGCWLSEVSYTLNSQLDLLRR